MTTMTILLGFGMVTALLPAAVAAQTTFHVDDDHCPSPGAGTEADPFCRIQDAIVASASGDEIIVAPGTYNELINFLGKGVALRSSGGRDVTIIDAGPFPIRARANQSFVAIAEKVRTRSWMALR